MKTKGCGDQVVVAKSGNAVGKTFIAARLAAWWLLCFEECQVYTCAEWYMDGFGRNVRNGQ